MTALKTHTSRRHFLRACSALSGVAAAQQFSAPLAVSLAGLGAMAAQNSAVAANTSAPYKALVCLFMQGGSDMHNWVVPTDTTGYADYAAVRRELAWQRANLASIASPGQTSGRSFGMPLELGPLRNWYDAGQAAVLANVGPLVRPTSRAEFETSTNLPASLFSHNDQSSTWQSLAPEGARSGWGGRMGDLLMSANQQPSFTAISATGNAVFLSGSEVTQYQVGLDGPVSVRALTGYAPFSSSGAPAALARTLANTGAGDIAAKAAVDNRLQSEYSRVLQRSIASSALLQTALASTNVPTIANSEIVPGGGATLDRDSLARQLRMVARLIAAGQSLGMRRQVFMVGIGGFDSHANQMRDQPVLMARVAQSVNYFLSSLNTLGMLNNVTLFTASEFGRTLSSNGAGSDHGWGSHHLIAGGAVKGRDIYGRFPITALGTADDVGSGRLLPSTSVTQYAATLGTWMGLSNSELATVLPNLGNFSMGGLNFM